MPDGLTIDVDASAVLAMLDQLGERARLALRLAAKETAQAIAREARSRTARASVQTGRTLASIVVDEYVGYVGGSYFRVYVKRPAARYPVHWPVHLEFGTKFMPAEPFLIPSAQLEVESWRRRIIEELQALITEVNPG